MTNLRNLFGLFLLSTLFFTSCKKESLTTTNPEITTPTTPSINQDGTISTATSTRALAAAASVANSRNNPDTTANDCGCYDLFENIDLDGSGAEIEAAIETVLENLSEEELIRLFEPVCTADGQIYESACIADCEGITDYHVCSDEELDDHFFGDFDCGDLDNLTFPTEIELPDGTLITVNSEEELWELLENWFEEQVGEWGDEDGEWEGEYDEDDFEDCFTLVFPISIQFPGGELINYNSLEELYTGIDLWYNQNPESMEDPLPVYPFEAILPDSSTVTINNEIEEELLWEECYGEFDICFELAYPINLAHPDDSTTIAINNDSELEAAIDAYYTANPDTEEDLDFQYPINVTLSDGTTQEVANENALEELFESCFDDFGKIGQAGKKTVLSAKRVAKGTLMSGNN